MAKLNKKSAFRLANICLWAYDFDETTEAAKLEFNGEDPVRTIEVHDHQPTPTSFAGIIEYEKFIVVVFQGTITEFGMDGHFSFSSLKDWIQNFKVKQVETNKSGVPGKVHYGFFKQLDLIYAKVKHSIPAGNAKPLVLTGHSQGGAIAAIATKKLQLDGFKVKETYTFAAPRPGDSRFAKSLSTPFFRVEFGHDIVPHVPPTLKNRGMLSTGLGVLGGLVDLPSPLEAFRKLIGKLRDNSYQSVGALTYGSETGELSTDLDAKQESHLFKKRKRKLFGAGKSLGTHHGLANYISMLS